MSASGRSVVPAVRVLATPADLSLAAADEFARRADAAVGARGAFTVALSGGSTPRGLYEVLAGDGPAPFRQQVPWAHIHVFWGDERHVPPDHPESNYGTAREALLSRVPILPEHIHRIPAERPEAGQAAEEYARTLRAYFRLADGQWPRFDLVLLGMGPDGHTASLFPGSPVLRERARLVCAPWVERLCAYRITLTPPVLNHAACVLFLVAGEDKADTLRAVLHGEFQPDRLPAQVVRPTHGELMWLVDQAAARRLPNGGPRRASL